MTSANLNNVKRFKDFDPKYKPLFGSSGYSILFDAGKFSFSEKRVKNFKKNFSRGRSEDERSR